MNYLRFFFITQKLFVVTFIYGNLNKKRHANLGFIRFATPNHLDSRLKIGYY